VVTGTKTTSEAWEYNESVRQIVQSGGIVLLMSSAVVVQSSHLTSVPRPHYMLPRLLMDDEDQLLTAVQCSSLSAQSDFRLHG